MRTLRDLLHSEEAATAIEYALIALLISTVAIVTMQTLGGQVSTSFGDIVTAFSGNPGGGR